MLVARARSRSSTIVDVEELKVYGAATKTDESNTRPCLIELANKSDRPLPVRLLHLEFETNPANADMDYRIHAVLQSVAIVYDAVGVRMSTILGNLQVFVDNDQ